MSDRRLLLAGAFLRAVANDLMGVLPGLYRARLEYSAAAIGAVIGAGLSGAVLATLIATFLGDRLGRRRALVVLTLLAVGSGVALIFTEHVAAASARRPLSA